MLAGLALWVGAGLHVVAREAAAQDTTRTRPPRRDTTVTVPIPQRADSSIVPDTTRQRIARADSLQAPFARAESPPPADVGLRFEWDRDAFFSTGAVTLLDLLERVPGLTGFRAGWSAAPMAASYLGVPGRIRIYMDGIELDPLQPRERGMNDLAAVQLWQLEDVVVERGASEVRVFVRSWRHDRTTPYTRIDVYTGDEESNSYRGYYGKRWRNGLGLQVGAQQFSVSADPTEGGSGSGLSLLLRLGWARGNWSIDGALNTITRSSDGLVDGTRFGTGERLLTGVETRDRRATLRAGWRSPDRDGAWLQLVAMGRRVDETGERITTVTGAIPIDTTDSLYSRPQYLAAAGLTRGGVRGSAFVRARGGTGSGEALLSPGFRLSVDRRWLSATALAERVERFDDSTVTRLEAIARLSPFSWLSFGGAASREDGVYALGGEGDEAVGEEGELSLRGEVGLRLGRTWISGGFMQRGDARLFAPQVFYAGPRPAPSQDSTITGAFVALRGPVWKAFGIDAYGVRWDRGDALYRPQFQSRSELWFRTNLLKRFPSGEFGFMVGGLHEYRSSVLFPSADGTELRKAPQSRVIGTMLELRLQTAVISYQYRNVLGQRFEYVPGFAAPRPIQVYGVRWEFWN